MKKGCKYRIKVAAMLRAKRARFWHAWLSLPENKYWALGNPGKGWVRYVSLLLEFKL